MFLFKSVRAGGPQERVILEPLKTYLEKRIRAAGLDVAVTVAWSAAILLTIFRMMGVIYTLSAGLSVIGRSRPFYGETPEAGPKEVLTCISA
ncbi:MAG TPA: hypothetical protein DCL13_00280 [Peptococcaceae bacterium]|nr:hypothetical protein [Peptococcaceae bacterium]